MFPTETPRQIDVDSMSILHRNIGKKFDVIFRCILIKKAALFSRTLCDIISGKIKIVLTYFFRHNSDEQKNDVVLMYFLVQF